MLEITVVVCVGRKGQVTTRAGGGDGKVNTTALNKWTRAQSEERQKNVCEEMQGTKETTREENDGGKTKINFGWEKKSCA